MSQIELERGGTQAEADSGDYDLLMELIRNRTSVRKLKPDPIPDEMVTKVLEAGRWASSPSPSRPSAKHCRRPSCY